jgi:hypothetical protein
MKTLEDASKRDLYMLGVTEQLMTHFQVTGPFRDCRQNLSVMFLDYHHGRDLNLAYHTGVSDIEEARVKPVTLAKVYHMRAQEAAEAILTVFLNEHEEILRIEAKWYYRLGYRTEILFENLLDKLRKVWYTARNWTIAKFTQRQTETDDDTDSQDT